MNMQKAAQDSQLKGIVFVKSPLRSKIVFLALVRLYMRDTSRAFDPYPWRFRHVRLSPLSFMSLRPPFVSSPTLSLLRVTLCSYGVKPMNSGQWIPSFKDCSPP